MKTDRELLRDALTLVSKYHARETILVDWEKSVIEAINARLNEPEQAAERERIKKIIEQVGVQGNHNEWFDCVDVILERIE